MSRYIDADKLKKEGWHLVRERKNRWKAYIEGMDLDCVPTADVQEVRHGRWEHDGYDFPHGNDWVHCSVCGKRGINVPADLTPYCPNCGAQMDLDEVTK